METRDVKLRVELDLTGAAATADSATRPQPANPAAPALPGAPAPDAGAGQGAPAVPGLPPAGPAPGTQPGAPGAPGEPAEIPGTPRRSTRDEEMERRIVDRIRREGVGVLGAAAAGSLASEVEGIAASGLAAIPEVGGGLAFAFRAAQFGVKYGPAATAFIANLLPEELRPAVAAAQLAAEDTARAVNRGRATLDAFGGAARAATEQGAAEMLLRGKADPRFLARYAANEYAIQRELLTLRANTETLGREAASGALGSVARDVASSLGEMFTAGGVGR